MLLDISASPGQISYGEKVFTDYSVIKSRIIRWSGHLANVGARTSAFAVLVEELEGKRLRGRRRHRWEDEKLE
jgi:hypothetical protein